MGRGGPETAAADRDNRRSVYGVNGYGLCLADGVRASFHLSSAHHAAKQIKHPAFQPH